MPPSFVPSPLSGIRMARPSRHGRLSWKSASQIPVTAPKTPLIVKASGVEVVTLSTLLSPSKAERSVSLAQGRTFLKSAWRR